MWSAYRGALESINASVSRRQRHFPAAGHLLFMTAGAEEPLRWRREMICGGAGHSLWWNHPINSGSRHWIRSPNWYVCIVSVQIAAVFNHAYYVSVPWNWFRCATQTRCTVYYISWKCIDPHLPHCFPDMIERAIINTFAGHDVVEPGNYVQMFPYPCYTRDE